MAHIVIILPHEEFRDEELFETRAELDQAGHSSIIASTTMLPCSGMLGGHAAPDMLLSQLDSAAYDAVIFVGGSGVQRYYQDEQVLQIARAMHARGKVVAAICLAPVILGNAGVLMGKRATVAASEIATIEEQGAQYEGPGVVVDGSVVTADGPASARRFGQAITALLAPVMA